MLQHLFMPFPAQKQAFRNKAVNYLPYPIVYSIKGYTFVSLMSNKANKVTASGIEAVPTDVLFQLAKVMEGLTKEVASIKEQLKKEPTKEAVAIQPTKEAVKLSITDKIKAEMSNPTKGGKKGKKAGKKAVTAQKDTDLADNSLTWKLYNANRAASKINGCIIHSNWNKQGLTVAECKEAILAYNEVTGYTLKGAL